MKSFSLLVKPVSAHCNLRCAYCFYHDVSAVFPQGTLAMSPVILEKMISTYQSLPFQPAQYTYAWQGGEPTLAGLDFFRLVVDLQQKYGRQNMGISNALQTNSIVIDDEWASFLAEYNFLTGVSLDGPQSIHDHYRKAIGGGGSHEMVCKAMDALNRHHADFNLLCLVSQSNVRSPEDVFYYFRSLNCDWMQFIPCVETYEDGRIRPFAINGREWGEFLCRLFDVWVKERNLSISIRLFDAILAKLAFDLPTICHFGSDCRHYYVVEHNGDLFPCDFFVRSELRLGNIMNNHWKDIAESAMYQKFGNQKIQYSGKCEKCKYNSLCVGDCLKHRIIPPRLTSKQTSLLCDGWKMFFDHTYSTFKRLAIDVKRNHQQALL